MSKLYKQYVSLKAELIYNIFLNGNKTDATS